jgi:hypothetical protein
MTQNGKVAFLAVFMSCNAIPGFSSAVKRVSLGTEPSQRILKVIDRIPKISLKSVVLDRSSSKGCYKIIILLLLYWIILGRIKFKNIAFFPKIPTRFN